MFIRIINIKTFIRGKLLLNIKIINDLFFKTINVFKYIKINKKTLKSYYPYY